MSATTAITIAEPPTATTSEARPIGVGAPLLRIPPNAAKLRRNVVSLVPPRTAPVVGRSQDPTDPAPAEGSRPAAALLSRLFELGRLTKSLAKYFGGMSNSPPLFCFITVTDFERLVPLRPVRRALRSIPNRCLALFLPPTLPQHQPISPCRVGGSEPYRSRMGEPSRPLSRVERWASGRSRQVREGSRG